MRILIGTPVNTGQVTIQYLLSMRNLEKHFAQQRPHIQTQLMFGTSSFMPFSRNAIASVVLEDKSFSHLLFIDSDMGFQPEAITKMIDSDKDFIGCICPKRSMDFGRFHEVSRKISDRSLAYNVAQDYAAVEQLQKRIVKVGGKTTSVHVTNNGLIKTLRIGMAMTLIRREVIELMASTIPEIVVDANKALHYHAMGLRGRVIQCFSSASINNISLSEDLSFCLRWTDQCSGEIWACTDQAISHIGDATFTGKFQDRIDYEDREILSQV